MKLTKIHNNYTKVKIKGLFFIHFHDLF